MSLPALTKPLNAQVLEGCGFAEGRRQCLRAAGRSPATVSLKLGRNLGQGFTADNGLVGPRSRPWVVTS